MRPNHTLYTQLRSLLSYVWRPSQLFANKGHTRPWSDSLLMGSSFIKLMFTILISIHLFALGTFHKNLRRLEHLYVLSSFLIPLVINLTACHHGNSAYLKKEEFITLFAVVSLLMVVMGTILCHRACRRRNALLSEYDKQHSHSVLYTHECAV